VYTLPVDVEAGADIAQVAQKPEVEDRDGVDEG
jgi:hypothetical protein